MELMVQTDLAAISKQSIDFNAQQLKVELSAFLDKYTGLVVTDDNIPEARAARADVNKVRESINGAKITAKKAFMAPYTRFEGEVKGLLAMCDDVAANIDAGIKDFEAREKEARRKALLDYFQERTAGIEAFVNFADVFHPRWLLASAKQSEAKGIIDDYAERSRLNVEAIAQMATEPADKAALESEYRRSRDLASVMRLSAEIAARKAAAEKAAAEKAAAEQRDPAAEITKILQAGRDIPQAVREETLPLFSQTSPTVTAPAPDAGACMGDEMTGVTVRIWGTNGTVGKILQYITAAGATYEEVF